MAKRRTLTLLSVTLAAVGAIAFVARVDAASGGSDNAGNYSSWVNGSNGGTGFGAWDLTQNDNNPPSLSAGYFLGDSTAGSGNINTGGKSFGVYAYPNVAYATANRAFAGGALTLGQAFSARLAVNNLSGSKGLSLLDAGGNQLFNLTGGTNSNGVSGAAYSYANGTGNGTNLGFTFQADSVFTVSYLQQTSTTASIAISRFSASAGTTDSFSETITASNFTSFQFFVVSASDGSSQNNLYFNDLTVVPEPSTILGGVSIALGGLAVGVRRRRLPVSNLP